MCLRTLDEYPKVTSGIGYKEVRIGYYGNFSEPQQVFCGVLHGICIILPFNQWIEDTSIGFIHIYSNAPLYNGYVIDGKYNKGFHLYRCKQRNPSHNLSINCRVEFKDVVATGKQYRRDVVVARSIKRLTPITPEELILAKKLHMSLK